MVVSAIARAIINLISKFGLTKGAEKARLLGFNKRQVNQTIRKYAKANKSTTQNMRQRLRQMETDMYAERGLPSPVPRRVPMGETSPMPRRTTGVGERPPVSQRDWEGFYGKKHRGFGYGELGGAKNKPLWGPELEKAIDKVKGIKRQGGRYMGRVEMGMRKKAFKKHRIAMIKARELAKKARKAQADAKAHAEGIQLMDETTYGAF